jgi:hypothetical protein
VLCVVLPWSSSGKPSSVEEESEILVKPATQQPSLFSRARQKADGRAV